jgi:hypothetical protein
MITTTGKNILSKYLIGQAPAYASYIAAGCGPSAQLSTAAELDYSAKKSLDFEMFRAPIVSRGYVTENGVTEIVLTAEVPTEERYEITEVGVFSAGANPSAGANDSRVLYSFSQTENWEYHVVGSATAVPIIDRPLDNNDEATQGEIVDGGNVAFFVNADNSLFENNASRISRNERCRFLNNMVVIRGDMSEISKVGDVLVPAANTPHIHLTGISINLDKNSANDEIRLAFSVMNRLNDTATPDTVRVVLEFTSEDTNTESRQFAMVQSELFTSDLSTNRYIVKNSTLQDLVKSAEFSWGAISIIKVYVSILDALGDPDPDFYVAVDALRFENTNTINALYGLTGYSVVKTSDALPVVKGSNTANLLEFRFAMDVL